MKLRGMALAVLIFWYSRYVEYLLSEWTCLLETWARKVCYHYSTRQNDEDDLENWVYMSILLERELRYADSLILSRCRSYDHSFGYFTTSPADQGYVSKCQGIDCSAFCRRYEAQSEWHIEVAWVVWLRTLHLSSLSSMPFRGSHIRATLTKFRWNSYSIDHLAYTLFRT